jgi:hypothetical protein
LSEATATRIGTDFGFAGVVHRLDAVTTDGTPVSLVIKREDRESVERALTVRERNRGVMDGIVPPVFASWVDGEDGVFAMEHVHPSVQGDVLGRCTDEQAESLIRAISRVHASSLGADRSAAPWTSTVSDVDRATWETKLTAAARTIPNILDDAMVERLADLPAAVDAAVRALGDDTWCWIHADLHLDNVVFRQGTEAVILDWASARIGPPAIDVGHILTEGLDRGAPHERIERWGPVYADEADRFGVNIDLDRLRRSIGWSILPLLRGVIGWTARDEVFTDRLVVVRENLLRKTCEWLDTGLIPIEI